MRTTFGHMSMGGIDDGLPELTSSTWAEPEVRMLPEISTKDVRSHEAYESASDVMLSLLHSSYHCDCIGRKVPRTKLRHTWMVQVCRSSHTPSEIMVEFVDSRMTGRKSVYVDGKLVHKKPKMCSLKWSFDHASGVKLSLFPTSGVEYQLLCSVAGAKTSAAAISCANTPSETLPHAEDDSKLLPNDEVLDDCPENAKNSSGQPLHHVDGSALQAVTNATQDIALEKDLGHHLAHSLTPELQEDQFVLNTRELPMSQLPSNERHWSPLQEQLVRWSMTENDIGRTTFQTVLPGADDSTQVATRLWTEPQAVPFRLSDPSQLIEVAIEVVNPESRKASSKQVERLVDNDCCRSYALPPEQPRPRLDHDQQLHLKPPVTVQQTTPPMMQLVQHQRHQPSLPQRQVLQELQPVPAPAMQRVRGPSFIPRRPATRSCSVAALACQGLR